MAVIRRNAEPIIVPSNYGDQILEGGQRIIAHKASVCRADRVRKRVRLCPIHRRSEHHMRSFPQNWRDDRRIMERICPHGIGHPDPDDSNPDKTHGCDGCCVPPEGYRSFIAVEKGY